MMRPRAFVCLVIVAATAVVSGQGPTPAPSVSADFVAPGPVVPLPAPVAAMIGSLRASAIAAHVGLLASPALEGRGLGSRGLEATAEYISASLALAGVAPLQSAAAAQARVPASAYVQSVPVREVTKPSGQVIVETRRGDVIDTRTFTSGVDGIFPEIAPETLAGPVVFAGYGIREAKPARDDYRGLDARDKLVVILGGVPAGPEWASKAMTAKYAAESGRRRFAAKVELAKSLGARAVLAIERDMFPTIVAGGDADPASRYFVGYDDGAAAPPLVRVSTRVGDALFWLSGLTSDTARDEAPRALPGVSATVRVSGDERLVVSRNIAAVIPGADPALRGEAVVLGAHMDHLGTSGLSLYPGADDNASGTAALLEIAKAFAASPHRVKRTLVFVWWTGEEEGHLGSEYYLRHPLWPIATTTVYLNLDMIGHPWTPEEIKQLVADTGLQAGDQFLAKVKPSEFLELGVSDQAPQLAPVLVQAAHGTGLALHLDRTDGKSGGSDYRAFARANVPFVRFFGNYFSGYHEPSDTPDSLDAEQVLRMTKLALASAWLFADR